MPAPWWGFLVPVVIDAVKDIFGGAKTKAKKKKAEHDNRRALKKAAKEERVLK